MDLQNTKFEFSVYYGMINGRIKNEVGKSIAKIEIYHLIEFLENKIKKGQYKLISERKGNTLPVIELK